MSVNVSATIVEPDHRMDHGVTLPNPIPAGSVVFVPETTIRQPQHGDYIDRSGSIEHLSLGQGVAIRGLMTCYTRHDITAPLHVAAFAPILESAQGEQEGKVKTVREQVVEAACDGSWVAPTGAMSALTRLADSIDSLRAEVRALKGAKS